VSTIAPMPRVGSELGKRARELRGERVVERVHPLRMIKPDQTDALAPLDDDVLVGHGESGSGTGDGAVTGADSAC
jgi:hypothetical protein